MSRMAAHPPPSTMPSTIVCKYTPKEIMRRGLPLVGYDKSRQASGSYQTNKDHFRKTFGSTPHVYAAMWVDLQKLPEKEYRLNVTRREYEGLQVVASNVTSDLVKGTQGASNITMVSGPVDTLWYHTIMSKSKIECYNPQRTIRLGEYSSRRKSPEFLLFPVNTPGGLLSFGAPLITMDGSRNSRSGRSCQARATPFTCQLSTRRQVLISCTTMAGSISFRYGRFVQ